MNEGSIDAGASLPAAGSTPPAAQANRRGTFPPGERPIVIVGPTASGKTALSLELATLLGDAEIVSVDSMQVYRRMDIGTGKASAAERATVPHHLIDIVEPSVEFSVGQFQDDAHAALAGLSERGRRPIFVGGTGLYHRAVVDGLELPGEYPDLRASLEAEVAAGREPRDLHARLAELDALAAERIEPDNARRIIRALEVTLGSGRRFSSFGPGLESYPPTDALLVGLRVGREDMGPRIATRVAAMMRAGFLDEVRALAVEPDGLSRTARQALGYRELLAHLKGAISLDEAVDETVARTRQFAVRQERWFRRDPRIEWFDAPGTAGAGGSDATETRQLAEIIAGRLVEA